MLAFIVRRLMISAVLLLVGTFLAYVLIALSGDPLADLRQDTGPDRENRVAARTELLNLDTPVVLRYFLWLGGASQCLVPFVGECDLGQSIRGQDVTFLLSGAIGTTLKLIFVATFAAAFVGILVGIVTALRQYTRLDYSATFASFVFVSLPLFWFAVLLKQYVAIDLNDWLGDPVVTLRTAVLVGLVSGLVWGGIIGGSRQRTLMSFGIGFVVGSGLLLLLSVIGWFESPGIGIVGIILVSLGSAVALTGLLSGFGYRNVLYAALAMTPIALIANLALDGLLFDPSWLILLLLLLATIATGIAVGYAIGGLQRREAIQAAVWTGVFTGLAIVADRTLEAWDNYAVAVNDRIVPTFGASTPNYDGGFWGNLLDTATHLALPTLALILVSVATYSRYTRASMLEVMNQDYVRTARSKGLNERAVVIRHAFRNGLIPITTLIAFDIAGLIGGAVVTETVFAWQGMGLLFTTALREVDPNPAMSFFVVTGAAAVVFNMLADIAYAYLDPRIRVS